MFSEINLLRKTFVSLFVRNSIPAAWIQWLRRYQPRSLTFQTILLSRPWKEPIWNMRVILLSSFHSSFWSQSKMMMHLRTYINCADSSEGEKRHRSRARKDDQNLWRSLEMMLPVHTTWRLEVLCIPLVNGAKCTIFYDWNKNGYRFWPGGIF